MDFSVEQVALHGPLPRYLVGVSSKMYFTHAETMEYIQSLASAFPSSHPNLAMFFIPSFPSLLPCAAFLQAKSAPRVPSHILLGGQDCSAAASGPHTGSVSAVQILEVGGSLVELGHAERRTQPFNESNQLIAMKAYSAIKAGLLPLVCIGERARGQGIMSEAVGRAVTEIQAQIEPVLDSICGDGAVPGTDAIRLALAYEPVWAIGADRPAEADHVNAVVREIRRLTSQYAEQRGVGKRLDVKIIYGGSAGPGTWSALKNELDGLFLGRFAHKVENVKLVVNEILS